MLFYYTKLVQYHCFWDYLMVIMDLWRTSSSSKSDLLQRISTEFSSLHFRKRPTCGKTVSSIHMYAEALEGEGCPYKKQWLKTKIHKISLLMSLSNGLGSKRDSKGNLGIDGRTRAALKGVGWNKGDHIGKRSNSGCTSLMNDFAPTEKEMMSAKNSRR